MEWWRELTKSYTILSRTWVWFMVAALVCTIMAYWAHTAEQLDIRDFFLVVFAFLFFGGIGLLLRSAILK
jgi:hypothetical protein